MISKIGIIKSNPIITKGETNLTTYEVLVPSISDSSIVTAYVLTQPGVHIKYEIGQQVLILASQDHYYIILGLFQPENIEGSVYNINIDKTTIKGGTISSSTWIDKYYSLLRIIELLSK